MQYDGEPSQHNNELFKPLGCWTIEQQLGDGNIYISKELPLKVDVITTCISMSKG